MNLLYNRRLWVMLDILFVVCSYSGSQGWLWQQEWRGMPGVLAARQDAQIEQEGLFSFVWGCFVQGTVF